MYACLYLSIIHGFSVLLQAKRDLFAKYEGNADADTGNPSNDDATTSAMTTTAAMTATARRAGRHGVGPYGDEDQRERVGRATGRSTRPRPRPSLPHLLYFATPSSTPLSSGAPPLPGETGLPWLQDPGHDRPWAPSNPPPSRQRHKSTVYNRVAPAVELSLY